jgi:hypothetical protein
VSSTVEAVTLEVAGRAAVGVVSARVVALAEGVLKSMLVNKLKCASAALVLIVVFAAGAVGLLTRQTQALARVEAPGRVPAKEKDKGTRQPAARAVAANIAWGKAKDGLQAGLALRPANRHSYRVGDAVRFVVKVRNVASRPVLMRYQYNVFYLRVSPSVLAVGGKRPPLSGPVYYGPWGTVVRKLALAVGQEVEFAQSELVLGPAGEPKVTATTTLQAGPGKYRVSYHVYHLNADDTGNYLTTGEVEVVAHAPDMGKASDAAGLTVVIRAGRERSSKDVIRALRSLATAKVARIEFQTTEQPAELSALILARGDTPARAVVQTSIALKAAGVRDVALKVLRDDRP